MHIFKKLLKITLIIVLSLIVLAAALAGTLTYIVFTPERLTPIVVKQANGFLNAKVSIENVELTFFSTFPDFGIKLNHVAVVNEYSGNHKGKDGFPCGRNHSDSLLTVDACIISADVKAYLDHKDIVIKGVELINPNIFAYIDSTGNANFDVAVAEEEPSAIDPAKTDTTTSTLLRNAALSYLKIQNANLFFQDDKGKIAGSLCDLNLNVDGQYTNNIGVGNVDLSISRVAFSMNDTVLASNLTASLQTSLTFDQSTGLLQLKKADVHINDISFSTSGSIQTDTAFSRFDMDLQLALKIPSLANLMAIVPVAKVPEAAMVKVQGAIEFNGNAKGLFKDSTSMPAIDGSLTLKNFNGSYQGAPYKLDKLNSSISMLVDLNQPENSQVNIAKLTVEAINSKLNISGTVKDILRDPMLNLSIQASTDLAKLTGVVPLGTDMSVEGLLKADLKTNMRISEAATNNFNRLKVAGTVGITGLKYNSDKDTMSASIGDINFNFETNARSVTTKGGKDFLVGEVKLNTLRAQVGKDLRANMRKGIMSFTTSNILDTNKLPIVHCKLDLAGNFVRTDSMRVSLRKLYGTADIKPGKANPMLPHIDANLELDSLRARIAHNLITLAKGKNNIVAEQSSDTTVGFNGWKTNFGLDYSLLQVFTPSFPEMVYVDKLVAQITEEKQDLQQCDIRIGDSDMQLTGSIENILPYLDKKHPLKTNIRLAANNLDLNQLVRISEAGSTVEVSANMDVEKPEHIEAIKQSAKIDTSTPELKAMMLPTDIFAQFETDVKHAIFGKMELDNIKGGINLADGALILQELGVVANKKSRMKITAIHRTPEANHIYAGMRFHLMGIELGDLQNIIPEVDTVLPMLRSFEGKVDFHLAAQTYLDSNYNVKYSTLRASSSIHGENLVLLDNQTFAEISKLLRFKNKERNVIDSLDVEVVVFKNQIELYPFLVAMDRYKVALGGLHKLDMNVNYHISLLDSPLPMRLGVDIKGNMDDIQAHPVKYVHLVKPKYANTFMPQKQNVVKSAEEQIRDQIRAALRKAAEE
ncbi:MAG: hypothetical protein LBK47_01565 [Prevotellaceae bacterium]|jgi:hypothetical protein|nr:hypothetical protein [Prevotellaceae bacterium]